MADQSLQLSVFDIKDPASINAWTLKIMLVSSTLITNLESDMGRMPSGTQTAPADKLLKACKLRERDPIPTSDPIVVNQCETKSLKVIRVIRQLTGKTQRFVSFTALYKALIGWIYERHEEILNRHDLPAYVHRMQQAKLISWLDHKSLSLRAPSVFRSWEVSIVQISLSGSVMNLGHSV
ncbi:hypothetical protein H4Q26_013069 [Puccinia striiformis f. sp. tritici PST-130]|nr:hypothetical protein H4Q26_013069 [Puccinia striiformis f. sp. tritici PST-130]